MSKDNFNPWFVLFCLSSILAAVLAMGTVKQPETTKTSLIGKYKIVTLGTKSILINTVTGGTTTLKQQTPLVGTYKIVTVGTTIFRIDTVSGLTDIINLNSGS